MTAEMAYLIIEHSLPQGELDKFIEMLSRLKTQPEDRPVKKPLMSDAQAIEILLKNKKIKLKK